ncbi:MAG: hypothetical protein M1540_01325 [Candidatus Bathyarchaeota archaeon]|nr:hypothetical protein [Candidatus Bathyarchaeota archaeon]
MVTTQTTSTILSFSGQKVSESEVEAAAVFAVAEMARNKGGGLLSRQPQETLAFLAKVGYPLLLFPKEKSVLLFDGLGGFTHKLPYAEAPSAKTFLAALEANQRPRENYLSFLSAHGSYFKQVPDEKTFALRGLIANPDFKSEFESYLKEATEIAESSKLLSPTLDEEKISTSLTDLDKLQSLLRDNQTKLAECLSLLRKTSSQYVTEVEFEIIAATEEAEAKIKAQAEFINPQIAALKKTYAKKIKRVTTSFDKGFSDQQKYRVKTGRLIKRLEIKIRQYEREAKRQGKQGHKIYEKRWKDKIKQAEKELSGLKKELKDTEDALKRIVKQKADALSNLNFELDSQVKVARQPMVRLEEARDAKTFALKQESNKLLALEKPIAEGIEQNLKLEETLNAGFADLGISDSQVKSAARVYVPFYVACYEYGSARRYLCVPPSTISEADFSSKLKGALGMSKTKNLLTPRFKTVATLMDNVEALTWHNSVFEKELWRLGEGSNLLKNSLFTANVKTGLAYLKRAGWLSEREETELREQL